MSQVKAKKKLHYYQGHEIVNSEFKIDKVLTLRDIDNLFDDIDADSELGLPLLSPLPKSTIMNSQKKSESSSDPEKMKASSQQVPKDALIQENGIQEDEMIDKESPFKELAPINTSSPIALATEKDETVDGVRPVADPLLFVEDEEPIGGDLSKASCTHQSEPVRESVNGDSGSLASPPERLEFRKTTKSNAGSLSSMKPVKTTKMSEQATQSSPPETKKDLTMEKDPSQLSPVLVKKSEPKLQEVEQCKNHVVEDPGKGLSFQHKLKKALMLKSPCSRKQAAVPAPSPADLEEDFMILDDEAPVLFVIPRKAEVSRNKRRVPADTAKENVLAEPHSTDQLSQSETDTANQHGKDAKRNKAQIECGKQKPKGKRGKASKKSGKDSVTHDSVEDGADLVTETLEDRVSDQTPSHTVHGHKAVPTGKKLANSKAPEPAELSDKDETNTGASQEIPVPESRATKKSSKSSKQERPGPKAKKESNKDTAAADHHSTKSNKKRKNNKKEETASKTKKQASKQQRELEQIDPSCEEQEHEPSPALNEQEEEQTTVVNKQSSHKEDAVDPGKKQKRNKAKRVEPKPQDPPTIASDISSDSPMCGKRKKRPPGEWWLTSLNESTTEPHPKQVLDTAQRSKASPKASTKQAAAVDSEETQSIRPAQKNQKKQKTHNVLDSAKKAIAGDDGHNAGAEQKTAKKTGGRRKPKSAATQPQVASPGEEVGDGPNENAVEISQELCSPNRQHNRLPGEKRVFDWVYSRESGSAQKQTSSSLRKPDSSVPDNIPQKRQRKAPSNWWEAPQSQEPADGLPTPHSPPPQKSKLTNTPLRGVVNKDGNSVKSQKTKNHTKNLKRNIINTPKSIKRSLASMNAIFASEKPENIVKSGLRHRKQGRRNLLHSLEDQSDHSSENMAQSDDRLQGNGRASFGFTSGVTVEPSGTRNKTRVSSGPNTLSDVDIAFRSGPSSMLELQRHEEDDDIDLLSSRVMPSSRVTPHVGQAPRVLAQCELCRPPLQSIVLEEEDWSNLQEWFSHLWPPASKDGRVISPDDFHWHSHGGRAMGHVVDLQSQSFSHGKILLGSFMKKPSQVDLDTVSVFSVISSCVRVDIDGVKSVFNSGQVFMIPSGQMYSIQNLCQEPAVLIYHRTQSSDTQS